MSTVPCPQIGTRTFAGRDTLLSPAMLVRRPARNQHWLSSNTNVTYHYLGRNASHALVRGLGLGNGAEVFFPSFFGPPVLQAPMDAGAAIRFYQVRADLSVRIEDIRTALTAQTRAIYLIHFNGVPGPIDAVMDLARERDLVVIEDSAHALLSTIDGRPAGSIGDGGVFSFYKWVPVPNGAAFVANRPLIEAVPPADRRSLTSGVTLSAFSLLDYADRNWGTPGMKLHDSVRALGRQVSRRSSLAYVSTGGVEFHHDELNYSMSAISHRIMAVQNWDEIVRRRRENYAHLSDLLADCSPSVQGELPLGATPLFYATAVADKRSVLSRLAARGIQGRNFWELHHPLLPSGTWADTDHLRRTTMELPIHQDLDAPDIERIAAAVRTLVGAPRQHVVLDRIAS